jgi:Salmonella virulence plasmid 65kDa B protein
VFRDRIDRTFTKSLYQAGIHGAWIVLKRDGTTDYFGNVPDGSVPEAVLHDDLGVREWLLVRSVDAFGNCIDYEYVQGPPQTDLTQMQLEPLLARVGYGKNLNLGYEHHAEVDFTYRLLIDAANNPTMIRFDHAHGHIFLDRVLTRVDVSLLKSTLHLVRSYAIKIVPSPDTGRGLLESVQETAGGLQVPAITFKYGRARPDCEAVCGPRFAPNSSLAAALDRDVLRRRQPSGGGTSRMTRAFYRSPQPSESKRAVLVAFLLRPK